MIIDDMHLRVEFGFQKIAANQFDNIEESEIDIALNIAQERFIKQRMFPKPGSAMNQKRIDDLRELVVKNYKLPVVVPDGTNPLYEPYNVYAVLPDDYLYLINDRSNTASTKEGNCLNRPKNPDLITVTRKQASLEFSNSTKEECPYYRELQVSLSYTEGTAYHTVVLFDVAKTGYKDGVEADEKFLLVQVLLDALNVNTLGLHFYWEQYGSTYAPNKFLVISDGTVECVSINLLVDGTTRSASFSTSRIYKTYKPDPTWVQEQRNNRLMEVENLYAMLRHPFGKTRRNSPISAQAEDRLHVYEDKEFLVSSVVIDYLRQPRRLSKRERLSCELSVHTHQEIVDLAVEYLQLSTNNPAYQFKVQDNNQLN